MSALLVRSTTEAPNRRALVPVLFPGSDRPLSFCALDVWRLGDKRGWKTTAVWRITGQDPTTKALTGKWATCRVETAEEQIERLTAERDKAERESAETMELLARAHALACSLGADVSQFTRERDAEKARADTAETRLEAVRAWVENASLWTPLARGNAWFELRKVLGATAEHG